MYHIMILLFLWSFGSKSLFNHNHSRPALYQPHKRLKKPLQEPLTSL